MISLFLSFLKIGLFSIGGGYSALPLIRDEIVYHKAFITLNEFTDIITISEMTPGPISINAATFVGTKTHGFLGSVVATLGFILPSFIIVLTLSFLFYKYKKFLFNILNILKPVIIGIIGCVAISMIKGAVFKYNFDLKAIFIFILSFYLGYFKKFQIFKVLPIAAILGIIFYI